MWTSGCADHVHTYMFRKQNYLIYYTTILNTFVYYEYNNCLMAYNYQEC